MTTAPELPAIEPDVDVFALDGAFTVVADLPGVRPADLTLRLDGQVLVMEARGPAARYRRTFALRAPVDEGGMRATLRDGVLTVTLPRPLPVAPRVIPIVEA